jgi:F-type H+-transporting ATPase subunit b
MNLLDILKFGGIRNLLAAEEHGAGGGGILEQLGISFDVLIIQAVGFLLLLWLMRRFFWKPISATLENRRQDINSTYDKLEADRRAMEQLRADYEQRLTQIENEARERIQEALGEAQQMRDQILDDARRQGEELIARAHEQANLEREKLLTELQTHVTTLALSAAERVIGESMDTDRHRRLVQEFIDKAEVR